MKYLIALALIVFSGCGAAPSSQPSSSSAAIQQQASISSLAYVWTQGTTSFDLTRIQNNENNFYAFYSDPVASCQLIMTFYQNGSAFNTGNAPVLATFGYSVISSANGVSQTEANSDCSSLAVNYTVSFSGPNLQLCAQAGTCFNLTQ